jgi:hypothetical protein
MRIVTNDLGQIEFYLDDRRSSTITVTPGHEFRKGSWSPAGIGSIAAPPLEPDKMRLYAMLLLKAADVLDEMRSKEEAEHREEIEGGR